MISEKSGQNNEFHNIASSFLSLDVLEVTQEVLEVTQDLLGHDGNYSGCVGSGRESVGSD